MQGTWGDASSWIFIKLKFWKIGPLFPGVPQLENVISEGMIHQKIVRSARGMSLEHSKTCGTCSAGVTYSIVNRVWQNAGYLRRCLLLNLHKVEILEILTLICGGPPPTEGSLVRQHITKLQLKILPFVFGSATVYSPPIFLVFLPRSQTLPKNIIMNFLFF